MKVCSKDFKCIVSKQLIEKMTTAKRGLRLHLQLFMFSTFHHSKEWSSHPCNLTITGNRTLIEERDAQHVLQLIGLAILLNILSIQKLNFIDYRKFDHINTLKLLSHVGLEICKRLNKWIRDEMTLHKFKCSYTTLNH